MEAMSVFKTIDIKSRINNYSVVFVDDFTEKIADDLMKNNFFIIDKHIAEYYQKQLQPVLKHERYFIVEALEQNKTLDFARTVIKKLILSNCRKDNKLVAIGGGIIQDITGFIASILYRGIGWIFYPTTLLAQCDSCIGSKTSINLDEFKNQLGTFYPPIRIVIDVNFLQTLSLDEIKSGIGEIFHYYFISAHEQLKNLSDHYDQIIRSPELLQVHINTSLEIKKQVIEKDEFDKNERNVFNYGHTFGHAIEAVSGFSVTHGQAVTMGMDIANYISLCLGYLNKDTFEYMHQILTKNMPDFRLTKEDELEDYIKALSKDKKNIGSNLTCILTHGPGFMQKIQIPIENKFREMILSYFKLGI